MADAACRSDALARLRNWPSALCHRARTPKPRKRVTPARLPPRVQRDCLQFAPRLLPQRLATGRPGRMLRAGGGARRLSALFSLTAHRCTTAVLRLPRPEAIAVARAWK